jgi:hypothetical protein
MAGRKKIQLSAEERRGEESFAMWKELTDNISDMRNKTIRNAEIFTTIYDRQGQKDILGDETAPWDALLSQVEVFYTKAKVARWMLIWKTLHNEFCFELNELFGIDETKLEAVSLHCSNASEAGRYLELAKTASSREWLDEMNKLQGKPTREDCQHLNKAKFEICPKCGDKHKLS